MALILKAEHPEKGTYFAAVDPEVRHIEGKVAQTRMGAFLAAFKTEVAACEALLAVGAVLCVEEPSSKRARR